MKLKTVTIGIPALNEGRNIRQLLFSLLEQKVRNFELKEIIIVSDGSTDDTVAKARSIRDPRIKVFKKAARTGTAETQNSILRKAGGDILVMLDGDIMPADNLFLYNIVRPIIEDERVGLVGGAVLPLKPRNFIESVLTVGHFLKDRIYINMARGENIYLCHGRVRAFSRDFYKIIHWPRNVAEDAYSYLLCLQCGFKFRYAPKAKIYFRIPSNLKEHFTQSIRFFGGRKLMKRVFNPGFVTSEYRIPLLNAVGVTLKSILTRPLLTVTYLVLMICVWIVSPKSYIDNWPLAVSTKQSIR
jgi:glycosyltransferase involved in cell wall biosynthesis